MSFETLYFRNAWREARNISRDIKYIENDIYQMVFAAIQGKEAIIEKLEYRDWNNYDGPQAYQDSFKPRELKTVAQDITDNRDTHFLKEILGDTTPDVLHYIKFRFEELLERKQTIDRQFLSLCHAAFILLESNHLVLKK